MKQMLSLFKNLLGWPLSILAIFFIFKTIFSQKEPVSVSFGDINIGLLFLGFSCFLTYFFLRCYQWKKILQEYGHNLPMKEVAFLWSFAEIRRFIPGKIWPFLGRTMLFAERGISKKLIISSLVIESELLLLGSIIVAFLSFPFILDTFSPTALNKNFMIVASFIIISVITFFYLNNKLLKRLVKDTFIARFIPHILPEFDVRTNSFLLILSIFYMIFYGLGNYFVIASLSFLPAQNIVSITSFLVFSFLVGYLSFITPMGLGVRETVTTFGLAKILSLPVAAVASVYSRIVLIISELIFLYISYMLSKSKQVLSYKMVLAIFIALYIGYFTLASFLRYNNFYTGRYDLGNMDQTVWNTTQGRIFQFSSDDILDKPLISRLSSHADFILIALSPFYLLWSDPRMLLFIQTITVALGATFIFKLSNKIIGNKQFSLLFSLIYLLNPSIEHANLYDFHGVTLATTFLLGAFYFFIKKKYLFFILFALLAALTKEQVWIIISFFGLYLLVQTVLNKNYYFTKNIPYKIISLGMGIMIFTLSIGYYLVAYAVPQLRGADHFALSYYSDFGSSPLSIIKGIILSPDKTLSLLSEPDRFLYFKQIFLPLGFFSLFSPLIIFFALPDFVINLLSNNANLRQIYYQYTASITPFVFIAAIYGIKNIRDLFPKIPLGFYAFYLVITTIYSVYYFGPLPFAKNPNIDMFTKPQKNKEIIDKFLQGIDRKYSVAATNNLGSHLSQRERIFTIPIGIDKADIVVFLLNDRSAQPSLAAQKDMANRLKTNKNYVKLLEDGDFVAFKKI